MKYIERELEKKFLAMNDSFKAVMVTGARQVGKTTMLKRIADKQNRTFVTMDDKRIREIAEEEPATFFQIYEPPILIDEAQKAPILFERIKIICDQTNEMGLFWLTGSESKKLLKEAGDSLAGRICSLKMYGLSQREKQHLCINDKFDFSLSKIKQRISQFPKNNIVDIYKHIWTGSLPAVQEMDDIVRYQYYSDYVNNYLIRDAVEDNGILSPDKFIKLVKACAAMIGNVINYSTIARTAEIGVPTAKNWVDTLQRMGIIFLLDPFYNNELKRLVKSPKIYFTDTGLAAWLTRWNTYQTLMSGAASDHYFENYVVGEIMRYYSSATLNAHLSYYRDTNQKEIDLIIERDHKLLPIEIMKTAQPRKNDINAIRTFKVPDYEVLNGVVICTTDKILPIDANNFAIPCNII